MDCGAMTRLFIGQGLLTGAVPVLLGLGMAAYPGVLPVNIPWRPEATAWWADPSRFWDLYDTEDIALAEHKLPPADMPGVAWQAHSFFNSTTGAIFPLAPTQPLADDVQKLARHAYMAAVSWMDHQAGRILDELDSLGLTRTTICVLHGGTRSLRLCGRLSC